jgi:hypothetical protein
MTPETAVEAVERDVKELEVPRGIQLDVVWTITAATDSLRAVVAVWGPAERTCPGCDPVYSNREPIRECPVTLDPSIGEVQTWSQQHGCGVWWGPPWQTVEVDVWGYPSPDDEGDEAVAVRAALAERVGAAVREMASDVAERDRELTATARKELRRVLADALEELAAGADPEEVSTGDELRPGVMHDGGEWIAWCYDPSWDAGGSDFLEERESSLLQSQGV